MYVMSRAGCKKGDQCNFMHPTTMAMMQQVLDEIKPTKKTNNRRVTNLEESDSEMSQQDTQTKGRKVMVKDEVMEEEVKESRK